MSGCRDVPGEVSVPDFCAFVLEAATDDLPSLAGRLLEAQLLAERRLRAEASQPQPETDRLLVMAEVAERLGVKEHQAREMGRRGELPTVIVGERFVRVRAGALEEWIRRRENGRSIHRRGEY